MHRYSWHVGDYISHTAHLSPLQDLAYRRLLDWYYLHEKPVPVDVGTASKKIRMAEFTDDVQHVLDEFFEPSPVGWRHGRADEEILTHRDRQEVAEVAEEGKQTRVQRHREWRKEAFQALRNVGVVPHWLTKADELRRLLELHIGLNERSKNAPETRPETLLETPTLPSVETALETPATGMGDARETGLTINHEPLTITKSYLSIASAPHGEAPTGDLLGTFPGMGGGNRLPNCPHAEILAIWREELPDLPQHLASQWKGTRAAHLRARWRETAAEKRWTSEAEGLAYFRKFFRWLKGSPFLMGKVTGRNGRAFELELAWLVNPTNWAKTHEGKYHG